MPYWCKRALSMLLLITAGLNAACAAHGPLHEWSQPIPVVMGTEAKLTVVDQANHQARAQSALAAARERLDRIETLMSNYRKDSEITRLNEAPVGVIVPLSPDTMAVLVKAREDARITDGAFDVTCGPILALWREAGVRNKVPTPDELAAAVADTGWRNWRLERRGAARLRPGAMIDLGGIAKKYAIDLAAKAMRDAGAAGGMIDVGGDIVCFGRTVTAEPWHISIVDPAHPGAQVLAVLTLKEGSVCTSGDYERYDVIDAQRYSHIKDPRTGLSCDSCPSVTVIGKDAMTAGVWSTALSVLGPKGLAMLPKDSGLEAMMVIANSPGDPYRMTGGFRGYVVKGPKLYSANASTRATPRRGHAKYATSRPARASTPHHPPATTRPTP